MTNQEARAQLIEISARISVVRTSIDELMRKRLLGVDPIPLEILEKDVSGTVERAMEHCEKAEKARDAGRIMEAMQHDAKCVSEIGDAAIGN